jgi:glycerol-3-phosphate dehydrogenase (NAD(P)+)
MPQATTTILGAGSMGMAMAFVLSENNYKVTLWDIEPHVVDEINKKHKNPRSLPEVKLDKGVTAESNIKFAVKNSDMVVFAVSSNAIKSVAFEVRDSLARNCVLVSVAKGLEKDTFKPLLKVIQAELPGRFHYQIAMLSGPTLAHDIAERKPTAAMLASERSNAYTKRALQAFRNEWFHVYETRDVMGVSLSAVAKNALAVGSGIMAGLDFGSNTYAWVLTEGFREMARLIWKLGGQEETVYGLPGLGDTFATSFSTSSRNRSFGELLGKGKTVNRAITQIGETVEGVDAISALYKLALKEKMNLPVLHALYEVTDLKKNAKKVFTELVREL